ncbi:MAG TPA: hypothetical protein VKO86_01070 [Gemmatimonadales bacterium]|nr:hypothetical protein [Gemmatimonadales bacterium]
MPRSVATVCDTVAARWRATGRAEVRLADTTVQVTSDTSAQSGCIVLATAPQGIDSTRWISLYWAANEPPGWTDLPQYDADGPDGGGRTMEHDGVRCQVDLTQDGGDDSDSTYVPSPAIGETTFCWLRSGGTR